MKNRIWTGLGALLLTGSLLTAGAAAADPSPFASLGEVRGVMLTEAPQGLLLDRRQLRAGDALTGAQLARVVYAPAPAGEDQAEIACLCLTDRGTEEARITLSRQKNLPPSAEDSDFTTYKNISGQVPLIARDPEGQALQIRIIRQPKRGTLTVSSDGSVCYTPETNKVGQDSFSYQVTDPAGQQSGEATVRVRILKPSEARTYGDMAGDPAELAAVWLRETGIFTGETLSGQMLFGPDKPVTRGEFLAMCACLTGGTGSMETLTTGFADEAETPAWLGPFVTTGLRWGYLAGVPDETGLSLQADAPLTQAQAARLAGGMLGLRGGDAEPVMAGEGNIPAWAAGAAKTLAEEDVFTVTAPEQTMTRRDAALLLHRAAWYARSRQAGDGLLAWAAKDSPKDSASMR